MRSAALNLLLTAALGSAALTAAVAAAHAPVLTDPSFTAAAALTAAAATGLTAAAAAPAIHAPAFSAAALGTRLAARTTSLTSFHTPALSTALGTRLATLTALGLLTNLTAVSLAALGPLTACL